MTELPKAAIQAAENIGEQILAAATKPVMGEATARLAEAATYSGKKGCANCR